MQQLLSAKELYQNVTAKLTPESKNIDYLELEYEGYSVIDIFVKMNNKRDDEDEFFKGDLLQIYRRGLSILKIKEEIIYLRRGLMKFLDLDIQKIPTLEQFPAKLYVQEKANGANVQITYCEHIQSWVFCTKKYSIVTKDVTDLVLKNPRLTYAHKIAQHWYKLLEGKDQDKIQFELKNRTLVGEFCGDPDEQHLVQYIEPHFRFFALVEKDSIITALSVQEARQIINSLDFTLVQQYEYGVDCQYELNSRLINLFQEVSINDQASEGVVVYIENAQNILLTKIKTLQYKFNRDLRENMNDYFEQKNKKHAAQYSLQFERSVRNFSKTLEDLNCNIPIKDNVILRGKQIFTYCDWFTKQGGDAQQARDIIRYYFFEFLSVLDEQIKKNPVFLTEPKVNVFGAILKRHK